MLTSLINRFTSPPTTRPSATGGIELLPKPDKTALKQVPTGANHRSLSQRAYDFVTCAPSNLWNSIPPGLIKEDKRKATQYKESLQKHKDTFINLGLSEEFNNLDKAYKNISTASFWGYHKGNYWGNINKAKKALKEKINTMLEYYSSKYGEEVTLLGKKSGMTIHDSKPQPINKLEGKVPQTVKDMEKEQLHTLLSSLLNFRTQLEDDE